MAAASLHHYATLDNATFERKCSSPRADTGVFVPRRSGSSFCTNLDRDVLSAKPCLRLFGALSTMGIPLPSEFFSREVYPEHTQSVVSNSCGSAQGLERMGCDQLMRPDRVLDIGGNLRSWRCAAKLWWRQANPAWGHGLCATLMEPASCTDATAKHGWPCEWVPVVVLIT